MSGLREMLSVMVEKKASDLHIAAGTAPHLRIDGSLVPLPNVPALGSKETRDLCYELLAPDQIRLFEAENELDFSFAIEGVSRFRANLYRQKGTIAGAFRAIPISVPDPQSLGIPESVVRLIEKPRGLIVVTGPTGSGKSTTLASFLHRLNLEGDRHIVTIEDPIEFVHEHRKAFVTQREIGADSKSFANALKYVLRQDPDVILIGEMRDLETMASALTISETGHLVFATLHTNTAVQTINRIIDVFPPHQQTQVRTQLSFTLEGILSQQLIPRTQEAGGGRVLALEALIPTTAIRNLIRENKIHQIEAQMQMGQQQSGMFTMNQSLAKLAARGEISRDEGLAHATDAEDFQRLCPAKPAPSA